MRAQPNQYGDALMDMAKTFAPALDMVLPGAGTAASFILDIFGDKPCDYQNAAPCKIVGERWDGEHVLAGDCCNAQPGGLSVLISEHNFGYKKWPTYLERVRAADYYHIACGDKYVGRWTPAGKPGYCAGFEANRVSSMVIPEGFRVQLFDQPAFGGQSVTLESGAHDLHALGWGDRTVSLKVRGPWTLRDYYIGQNLIDRKPGWITAGMKSKPAAEFVLALIMSDPQRPEPPMEFDQAPAEYESSFGPGWERRPHAKQVFDQVQAGPQQQAAPPPPPEPSAPMYSPPPMPAQPSAPMPPPPRQPAPPMPQQWQPGPNPFAPAPAMQSPAPWYQPPPMAPWNQPPPMAPWQQPAPTAPQRFSPAPSPMMPFPPEFMMILQQLFQQYAQQPAAPPPRAPWYGR